MTQNSETSTKSTITSKPNVVRKLYDWVLHWAETPYGIAALVVIAFAESSIFPLPPDILLIALVIARPKRWWSIAGYCTAASVVGGLVGYSIGHFAWQSLGIWIVENVAHMQLVDVDGRLDLALPTFAQGWSEQLGGKYLFEVYDKWGAWIVGIFALTPLPYKLVTIFSGVAQVNIPIFILTSTLARGLRFFAVAFLLYKIGTPAKEMIDRHFNILTIAFCILLIGGFAVIKLLF